MRSKVKVGMGTHCNEVCKDGSVNDTDGEEGEGSEARNDVRGGKDENEVGEVGSLRMREDRGEVGMSSRDSVGETRTSLGVEGADMLGGGIGGA